MRKIIAFAGRLGSGKTLAAECLVESGYSRLYFALPLKELVCKLIGIKTVEELNQLKNVQLDYKQTIIDNINVLVDAIGVQKDEILGIIDNLYFRSVREVLQNIGTELIRNVNQDWHINELKKIINSPFYCDKNIVIDDVRFPNEKRFVREMGGKVWFIVRNKFDNISHHVSEESVLWDSCDGFILNNKDEKSLLKKIEIIRDDKYIGDSPSNKVKALYPTKEEGYALDTYDITIKEDISRQKYYSSYSKIGFVDYIKESNVICVIYGDGSTKIVDNLLCEEDLKRYLGINMYTHFDRHFIKKMYEHFGNNRESVQRQAMCLLRETIAITIEKMIPIEGIGEDYEYKLTNAIDVLDKSGCESDEYGVSEWTTRYHSLLKNDKGLLCCKYSEIEGNRISGPYVEEFNNMSLDMLIPILMALRGEMSNFEYGYE